jgi:hypothetical protein
MRKPAELATTVPARPQARSVSGCDVSCRVVDVAYGTHSETCCVAREPLQSIQRPEAELERYIKAVRLLHPMAWPSTTSEVQDSVCETVRKTI